MQLSTGRRFIIFRGALARGWIALPLCLALGLLIGCATSPQPTEARIRRDLIGHTLGSDFRAWQFREGQIQQLTVERSAGQALFVDLVLHDDRTGPSYHAKAVLRYRGGTLESLGLLSIEQVR